MGQKSTTYMGGIVPISKINVFSQVRKTFNQNELQELADDIALHGILQPTIVAKLDKIHFLEYKKTFEAISKKPIIKPVYVNEGKNKWYYCVIAGERRYRAHKILWDTGCTNCKEIAFASGKKLKQGECFRKHFKGNCMEVRITQNIDPVSAKSIQFRENTYVRPPQHEEAEEYDNFFKYLSFSKKSKLTMKEFASYVGVSVERVSRALHFRELPEEIQDHVKNGSISFANSLELRKIMLEPMDEFQRKKVLKSEIDYLLLFPRINNKDYKKRIKRILELKNQIDLFGGVPSLNLSQKRKIVAQNLIPGLINQEDYVNKVAKLVKEENLGKGKTFSGISPKKQLLKIFKQIQLLFPELHLSKKQFQVICSIDFENNQKIA